MRKMSYLILISLLWLFGCGDDNGNTAEPPPPETEIFIEVSPSGLTLPAGLSSDNVSVSANAAWIVTSGQSWCTVSPAKGYNGDTSLRISAESNKTGKARQAALTFTSGNYTTKYIVTQELGEEENYVPAGYSLVWQDEFNVPANTNGSLPTPGEEWWFETGNHGWGNHELQNYVDRISGTDTVAKIKDGSLVITAIKLDKPYQGSDIISARMNTKKAWKYGYFEMRAKLPKGKGTWAAFWMLPEKFENWPLDGEIDIMEYVGYQPDVIHSTIHTQAYNHSIGTQKGTNITIKDVENDYHIYGLQWTEDEITGYVDGKAFFRFENDKKGDKKTWPFNVPFYLKLNLAIGGDWGGQMGVDPDIFPALYHIDYVRVYQK
ncbi:MAG TPA: licheninase [Dysgonomonas sp.]|nr:licheninase [Dysgonomonas sp.]